MLCAIIFSVNRYHGREIVRTFLSGFPLSNETAIGTFAFSGNTLFSILELMAAVRIGAKKVDAILMSLGGIVSTPTAFLLSASFRSFFTLSAVVELKEKNYLFLVTIRYYLIFDLFDAGVILVQVYDMLNFICAIYIACGRDGFKINVTTYFNNVYIIAVK